jgi:hypothetical protein
VRRIPQHVIDSNGACGRRFVFGKNCLFQRRHIAFPEEEVNTHYHRIGGQGIAESEIAVGGGDQDRGLGAKVKMLILSFKAPRGVEAVFNAAANCPAAVEGPRKRPPTAKRSGCVIDEGLAARHCVPAQGINQVAISRIAQPTDDIDIKATLEATEREPERIRFEFFPPPSRTEVFVRPVWSDLGRPARL